VVRQSFYECPFDAGNLSELAPYYRFATSVVMFGSLLKQSKFMNQIGWNDVIEVANQSYDSKDPAQAEFILLLDKAKKIYAKEKKKKKSKEQEN
jgi:Ca-activated chloride channel family protein